MSNRVKIKNGFVMNHNEIWEAQLQDREFTVLTNKWQYKVVMDVSSHNYALSAIRRYQLKPVIV
jgi:hypothetical protein